MQHVSGLWPCPRPAERPRSSPQKPFDLVLDDPRSKRRVCVHKGRSSAGERTGGWTLSGQWQIPQATDLPPAARGARRTLVNDAVKVSKMPRNSAHHALTWCHSSALDSTCFADGGRWPNQHHLDGGPTAAAAAVTTSVARVTVAAMSG